MSGARQEERPPLPNALCDDTHEAIGYAALQSGGRTTWAEFDLEPATYAVICFNVDPVTGRPHVMDGMATVFTVE